MMDETPWFGLCGGLAAGLLLFKFDIFGFELTTIGGLSPSVSLGILIGSSIGLGIVIELGLRWLRRERED